MYTSTLLVLLATSLLANADFLITRSMTCLGAFPLHACTTGPAVLTTLADFNCDKLEDAMNNVHIRRGTVGFYPNGTLVDPVLESDGICGSAQLNFTEEVQGEYVVMENGNAVGNCVFDNSTRTICPVFLGLGDIGYLGAFTCTSSLCS